MEYITTGTENTARSASLYFPRGGGGRVARMVEGTLLFQVIKNSPYGIHIGVSLPPTRYTYLKEKMLVFTLKAYEFVSMQAQRLGQLFLK